MFPMLSRAICDDDSLVTYELYAGIVYKAGITQGFAPRHSMFKLATCGQGVRLHGMIYSALNECPWDIFLVLVLAKSAELHMYCQLISSSKFARVSHSVPWAFPPHHSPLCSVASDSIT